MPKIERVSAFKRWTPFLNYTHTIKIIENNYKQELKIIKDDIDNSQVVIFDGKIIVYRLKKVKTI